MGRGSPSSVQGRTRTWCQPSSKSTRASLENVTFACVLAGFQALSLRDAPTGPVSRERIWTVKWSSPWIRRGWGATSTTTPRVRRSLGASTCCPIRSASRSSPSPSSGTTGRSVSTRTNAILSGAIPEPNSHLSNERSQFLRLRTTSRVHAEGSSRPASARYSDSRRRSPWLTRSRSSTLPSTEESPWVRRRTHSRFLRTRPKAVAGSSKSLKSGTSPSS